MKNLRILLPLGLSLAASTAACKDDGASCEKVTDHIADMMGDMAKDMDKAAAIKKCESEFSAEERACALKAKDLAALQGCKKK